MKTVWHLQTMCKSFIKTGRDALHLRRSQPDVIYVHLDGTYYTLFYGLATRLISGRPLVVHLHIPYGEHPRPPRFVVRLMCSPVSLFIAVSRNMAEHWLEVGVPFRKIETVENGVDTQELKPMSDEQVAQARASLGILLDAMSVLFAGRVTEEKGAVWLINNWSFLSEALSKASSGRVHPILLLAGGISHDTSNEALASLQEIYKTGDDVLWLGWQSERRRMYCAADLVIVPSIWAEPFGLAAVEALACGTPVVAARRGGIIDTVGGIEPSALFEAGDVDSAVEVLTRLIPGAQAYIAYKNKASTYVTDNYSIEKASSRIETLLRQAATSCPPKRA